MSVSITSQRSTNSRLTVSVMSTSMLAARNLSTTSKSPCSQAWNSCSRSWWEQHRNNHFIDKERKHVNSRDWYTNMAQPTINTEKFLSSEINLVKRYSNLHCKADNNYRLHALHTHAKDDTVLCHYIYVASMHCMKLGLLGPGCWFELTENITRFPSWSTIN